MSLVPEECLHHVAKGTEELKSIGTDDGVAKDCCLDETAIHSSGNSLLGGEYYGQQASKSGAIDKPVDKASETSGVLANIQCQVGDGSQQINDVLQGMYLIQVNTTKPDK